MKKQISYVILVCLVLISIPRDVLHNHEHHDEISHSDSDGVHFEEGHCFVCAFTLDESPAPVSFNFGAAKINYAQFNEARLSMYAPGKFNQFTHRGPPAIV